MGEILANEPRLLVFGYFGGRNFGDEMMLLGLLEEARRSGVGDVRIITPDRDIPAHLAGKVTGLFPKSVPGVISGLRWATAFATCGGTVFHDGFCDARHRQYRLTLAGLATLCLAARLSRRRVYLMAIGMGPFRRLSTKLLTRVAAAASTGITFRDRRSLDDAISIGVNGRKARQTRDLAFAVPVERREKSTDRLLVLSLVSPALTDTAEAATAGAFVHGMAMMLREFLAANPDWRVALLAVAVGERDNDLEFTCDFLARLEPSATRRVTRIEFNGHPKAFMDCLTSASAVIASRYHIAVVAENMKLPTLWVPYQRKVSDGAVEASVPPGRIFAPHPSSLPGIAGWLSDQSSPLKA